MAYSWWDNYTAPFNEAPAGGGGVNTLYFTSTHDYVAYGPNYITFASTGNINNHEVSQPGTSNVLATALAAIPITWSGITVPAASTLTRVTVSTVNGTGAGTAQATVVKMDTAGTKTNLNTGGTTALTCGTVWNTAALTMDTGTSLVAGDTIGILIGEFTQTNTGAGAAYTIRVTYEFTLG